MKKTDFFVQEYLKCKNDFKYFCNNYVKLEVPGGDIAFEPYAAQLGFIDVIQKDHFAICNKSRQIGISTIASAYAAWLLTFYKNVVVGLTSKDSPEATRFARRIATFVEKLPVWMKPKFKKRTEQTFILDNGGECYSTTVNPVQPEKTLRGASICFCILDEVAHTKYMDQFWTSLVPALASSQKAARLSGVPYGTAIISTPSSISGTGKWYYQQYMNAVQGNSIFKPYTIHWRDIPELANDPQWFEQQRQMYNDDPRKIAQELDLQFISTSGSFFDEATILKLQAIETEPINKLKLGNGEAWIFKNPEKGRKYLISCDTAPENGSDKSAINIIDYISLDQVWEYQGKLPVKDFVKIIEYAAMLYPGSIIVENNSYGNQVVEELGNSEVSLMLYKDKSESKIVSGVNTNSKTRPLMIDALYSYITQYPETIKSKRVKLELIGLITKTNGKVEADIGCHDDLAMSLAFAYYVRKYDPPLMMTDEMVVETEFSNILDFNSQFLAKNAKSEAEKLLPFRDLNPLTNLQLTNKIKNKIFDKKKGQTEFDGFVNVFDYLYSSSDNDN